MFTSFAIPLAGPIAARSPRRRTATALIERNPVRYFRASIGPPFCFEPAAPIGRFQSAPIRDRRAAELRRRRGAPTHHGNLALTVTRRADKRRHHSRGGHRKAREIACLMARDHLEGVMASGFVVPN